MKGFKEKICCVCGNKYAIIIAAAIIVLAIILILNMSKGDGKVEFIVLSEAEVPQQIATEVVPEYRGLERALACVVDDKIYVVVTRGEKPTSGYSLEISDMELEKEDGNTNLIVNAKFKDPEPGDSLSQVLTYPLEIAETELQELPGSIELRVKY